MADSSHQLRLEVATPNGMSIEADVDWVQIPGSEGELGVLPGHLPLLSAIKPGVLRYSQGGTTKVAAVDSGYVEAGGEEVTLLTTQFTTPDKVEVSAVNQELADAEKALKAFEGILGGQEHAELERAVNWAHAQLRIATD
jgi:F-type H+-transporting ATPase subunit epsilon